MDLVYMLLKRKRQVKAMSLEQKDLTTTKGGEIPIETELTTPEASNSGFEVTDKEKELKRLGEEDNPNHDSSTGKFTSGSGGDSGFKSDYALTPKEQRKEDKEWEKSQKTFSDRSKTMYAKKKWNSWTPNDRTLSIMKKGFTFDTNEEAEDFTNKYMKGDFDKLSFLHKQAFITNVDSYRTESLAKEEGLASISGPPADSTMHANNFGKKKENTLIITNDGEENLTDTNLSDDNLTDKELGEDSSESLQHILLNETYIQDQFGVFYRPVYIGENYIPHYSDLIFENKIYTTEGLGNCTFCQGAGKITVENLGLKDCPDCDGTGDIQTQAPVDPMAQLDPNAQMDSNANPNGQIEPPQPDANIPTPEEQAQVPNEGAPDQFGAEPKPDLAKSGKRPDDDNPFTKESYAKEEDENWITVSGNHILVKKGQSKKQAVQDFIDSKNDDLGDNKSKKEDKADKPKKRFTLKKYQRDENRNYHAENALALVEQYGTPEEIKELKEINKEHERVGHLTSDAFNRRYEISNKYYEKLLDEDKNGYQPEEEKSVQQTPEETPKNKLDTDDEQIEKFKQEHITKMINDMTTKQLKDQLADKNIGINDSTREQAQTEIDKRESSPKWDEIQKDEITPATKKFAQKFVRSKHNTEGKTVKEISEKNTRYDKIKSIDDEIWDENSFTSGKDTYSRDGMSKYKKTLNRKLDGNLDSIDDEIHEWLTDDNHHSLNQALNELKSGIEDGEIEDWWDKSTLKSKVKLMDFGDFAKKDQDKLKSNYDDSDSMTQSHMRLMYVNRKTGTEAKLKSGYIKCDHCDQQFSNVQWLVDHVKEQHPNASECKKKASEANIIKYKTFINTKINILKTRARSGEAVSLMYGLPTISKQGRKIKGILAYAGVSLNDRIYLPEELSKGHGKTLPLLLNHSSIAGAEEELYRLTDEMVDHLKNEKDYQLGEVTLNWDAEKLTLYYEGVVDHPFFQKEIDDMNMAVSLGIFYDSDSPQVCDETCYTIIKGAEFREVSLVYHAGFPIATIEAVEVEIKRNAKQAMEDINDYNNEINGEPEEGFGEQFDTKEETEAGYKKREELDESTAEEETDELARGGSVDVEEEPMGEAPVIDLSENMVAESLTTNHDFSISGVTGMTISNSNGVERYTLDPSMSYETNMIHFNVSPRGAQIYGEELQLQPKMTTPPELTKEIEKQPPIKFTDADEDAFKKKVK